MNKSMSAQQDENGVEGVIYYLSRVLNDTKTRYSPVENLCLSLYFSGYVLSLVICF